MIDYYFLKTLHITCVGLTFLSFSLRAAWMLRDVALLHSRWARTVPHVIDTLLLLSGLGLAWLLQQYPGTQPWLSAKLLALLAYILFGSIALKRGKTKTVRVFALFAAYACFAYMLLVARAHAPLPW